MNIELTKKQYRDLIAAVAINDGIFGILGDTLPDTGYKKRSKETEKLESHLLQYAKDFDSSDLSEDFEGRPVLDSEVYETKIMPILDDFEEFAIHDGLANKLAWRDFKREHTKADMEKMAKKNGGYFGVVIYDYEKKYWDEFEKHEYSRLEIVE
ncbi:MAG: hypothetical protein A3C02_01275 [Candidatus Andersenbacteria bacterium RIFCSPHIGHO2_02_FULL_45_11]|uniref:Uncharacterized protein n=1 Tax=Candidatus Andersenbacteria bacterium RIFCSPHIGHO2_12_FULL_45_11 TaxID=1797281 RepID=A0A1G1X2V8_9BACT|nr:MAG: hypothetical protein A2805_00055 [Candidatus Andersenbacteria bacterium RIFCSPHIGHO2_01_FULL_46_36]OGY34356.1 MAG: hypothetical protein A3D99_02485 [Candidatus Andersenbacteria bacterium RIFCSPHIGHO2_12_FULL_45_11]OGY34935.1 MAG: hypothetical protein A3C02_01275 [Candidatus Andersenbacteria bacterium RIFCSPHIGHO2_02_FULL_45_11]